ncbi:DUF4762 family protein [uncultured Cedecea sp.]|uniref:DUF4762 family protein n=1 Tax=uncultured Cedecea sp. TaxID=988762 RepID=UPI002623D6A6|nr:DUF4762 family protein [uncultured Cedecea sp.]
MKKLNMIEAAAVIGGTKEVCVSSYESVVIGGVASCKEVITCTDKHGNATTALKDAAPAACISANSAAL